MEGDKFIKYNLSLLILKRVLIRQEEADYLRGLVISGSAFEGAK